MALKFDTPITAVPLFHQGKVRDMYDLGEHFLMVASDRLSAFDVVLPTPIPGKGKILNQLSLFWFEQLKMPSHLVTANVEDYPAVLKPYSNYLKGCSMLVKKAKRHDVECIARGYIVGSGWKDYQKTGKICGHTLPEGLKLCSKIEPAIYTPSTKAESGHDENIPYEQTIPIVGEKIAGELRDLTLQVYGKARDYAATKGIILADTKFEFGEIEGKTVLIDEVLTPDSSRYWPAEKYREGENQESFDKQYVRDWLETLDWNKDYPGPAIPKDVVKNTLDKYVEIFARLTGKQPEI
ncbi:MAG: phosphoribosylaminoimidazolesuccinocarboxamide synthase [Candidatus Fibromonas sp.]|jgi:phosphoribosylaminoimidazole-succinocarboxamide synthase|nr:phosphoribosylaminoimidazolesuccinocarboxamide synthase [Candidatus Fibromonas sp.]